MRGQKPAGRLGQVLASYAAHAMPEDADVWPLVSSKLPTRAQAVGEGVQAAAGPNIGGRGLQLRKLLSLLTRRWPLTVPAVAVLVAALVVAYVAYIGPEAGEPTDVASEAGAPATDARRPLGEAGKEPQVALQAAGEQQPPAEAAQEDGGPQAATGTEASAEVATDSYPIPKGVDLTVGYGNPEDVFVVTADGTERLVSGPSSDGGAAWSPDCSRIAFTSNRPNLSSLYKIWTVKADDTDPVKLTHGNDQAPEWSPDGTRIAFKRSELGEGRVPPFGWPPLESMDVFVINADGSGETRLTDGPGIKNPTSWSPDGKRMLLNFAQPDTETGYPAQETFEIYVMNSDGTDMKNLSNRPGKDASAKWSPDGRLIVFESSRGDGHTEDIFVMDADGGNVRRLTVDPAADWIPYWSPDGKWISFTSRRPVPLDRRLAILRAQAEQEGLQVSKNTLQFMAEQKANSAAGANVWIMKADGSEVQHVIEGWGGRWSACKAQR